MQHADAVRIMASEKYLLEELTPELREEFEEHFFNCNECAFDMRAGSALIEHGRTVLARPEAAPAGPAVRSHPGGWFGWLRPSVAIPIFAVLLLFVGYLNFNPLSKHRSATGSLSLPQILPSASLVSVRGDRIPQVIARPSEPFLLFVDIPSESRFASYVCELRSGTGIQLWSIPVSAEAARNTLSLQVPGGQLAAGTYSLTVAGVLPDPGQNTIALARYPFELTQQ